MIGFVIGTLSLVALVAYVRRGRRGACGHGGGRYGRRWGWGGGMGGGRGGFRRYFLRNILESLETTPAQERAIAGAVEEFVGEVRPLRDEVQRSRKDLGGAYRSPYFDESLLGDVFSRHDDALERFRKALVGLMAKVHDVLDPEQRERLARIVERGGGYRAPHWM